ncbi:MAG: hypothetical protein JWM80_5175 [Cyanobacteria bacterium RYN_339]|nr:hypothetical protein [Cyanobacteria bacterium RYN_339]
MTTVRLLLAMAVVAALSGATKPMGMPGAKQLGLSLQDQAELKLTQGAYLDTLNSAYWASGQGEPIVPVLGGMLMKEKTFLNDEKTFVAFPFNAIWALGRIASPKAVAALKKYQAGKHLHDASLAIKAAELRIKLKDKEVGVSLREDASLFPAADHDGKVIKVLKRGTPVKALKFHIVNQKQAGPRGGKATFDRVKLLPNGPEGFLERAGDDFATIY